MSYPYLPVNPCCTDVVINTPCGCSSTITNGGCNNPCGTNLTASSTIVYNGPALSCTTAEPCDTLNVILQKIDEIICNLLTQINTLTIQVTNITEQITIINGDIINIYNQLGNCCSATTTTTSTTIHPCENFSLNNTGDEPVAIIITDCTTQEQEAIVLNPGDTNICVVTDSPLTVPGTVIVTPNGPCVPPTSSTTSTTSTSSTTTTTTTAIPCECLTFYNSDDSSHLISYKNCSNTSIENVTILANQTINVCGSQGSASDSYVLITVGADCIQGFGGPICVPTTTTTTTSPIPNCVTECLPYFSNGNTVFINKDNAVVNLTPYITGPIPVTGDVANTANKLWLYSAKEINEYNISGTCPFGAVYNKTILLGAGNFGSGMTAIDDTTLVGSIAGDIVEIDVATTSAGITAKFPMPVNRDISGDMIYTTTNKLVCSYVDIVTSDTYITISSISDPWGLYIEGGVLHICNNSGQIYSLNLITEVLTLVGSAGQSLNGASQNPECAVLDFTPTTTTTTTAACLQWSWNLTGIDPATIVTIEFTECGVILPTIVTQPAGDFTNPFVFCSSTFPLIVVGTLTGEGTCTL